LVEDLAVPVSRSSVSILIVDDDEDNREVLREVLSDAGYSVAGARDGAEALMLLRRVRPDVILLDLNMPIMDGLEFRAAQKSDPSLAAIPTVVMTAVDRFRDRIADLAPEAALPKPLKLAQLLAIVQRYAPVT
jgi:CheY-like chemotaxis protein